MPDPQSEPAAESPRARFEAALPRIDRIIRSAARRLALRPDEVDDFRSSVHLRLIDDDYAVLRRFGGRSSLATYLTAVVQNLARDYRIRNWGRWRPSTAAERLGVTAIRLELLFERDGFSLDEAIEKLRSDHGVKASRLELVELAGRLPQRTKARTEGGAALDSIAASATDTRPEAKIEEGERQMTLSKARSVLERALADLEVTDRLLLKMHYQSGLRVSAIARALDVKQRELYTRRDRCLRTLRTSLEAAGLAGGDVLSALGWSATDLGLTFNAGEPEEPRPDPSNVMVAKPEDDS